MKRSIALPLVLLLAPTAVIAETDSSKLRVGVLLALTGEAANWGTACRNAMTMSIEKLAPKVREQLQFEVEDDAMSPKTTISAFNKLAATAPLDLAVSFTSATSKALSPITESRKVPLIAIATDPQVSAGKKYAFNFWVTPEVEAKALAVDLRKRGWTRIARILTIHDGTYAAKESFAKEVGNEVNFVLDEEYAMDQKDFRPFLAKLRTKEKELDAVMPILFPGQIGLFAKQYREMGFKLPLVGWETMEDPSEVKVSEGALVGATYVNAGDANSEFLESYAKRFPGASSFSAGNCYDVIQIIGKVVEAGTTKDKIHEQLASLKDFHGVLGTYSATGDQRFSLPAAMKRVTATGFENE